MNITILASVGGFDIDIIDYVDSCADIAGYIASMMEHSPEIKPRPKFQAKGHQIAMPFVGTIESTELVPAKDGKREYCLAHVISPDGEKMDVRYFPPQKTWRAGEKATVQKGQYGPELKEVDEEIPF